MKPGDGLFLLAGPTRGIYSYLCKVVMRRHSAETILAYAMGIRGVLLIPLALLERSWKTLPPALLSRPGEDWRIWWWQTTLLRGFPLDFSIRADVPSALVLGEKMGASLMRRREP